MPFLDCSHLTDFFVDNAGADKCCTIQNFCMPKICVSRSGVPEEVEFCFFIIMNFMCLSNRQQQFLSEFLAIQFITPHTFTVHNSALHKLIVFHINWNSLPSKLVNALSFDIFKKNLESVNLIKFLRS